MHCFSLGYKMLIRLLITNFSYSSIMKLWYIFFPSFIALKGFCVCFFCLFACLFDGTCTSDLQIRHSGLFHDRFQGGEEI